MTARLCVSAFWPSARYSRVVSDFQRPEFQWLLKRFETFLREKGIAKLFGCTRIRESALEVNERSDIARNGRRCGERMDQDVSEHNRQRARLLNYTFGESLDFRNANA